MTGLLKITANGNTTTYGSQNSSCSHFMNSANIPFYFNKSMVPDGDLYPYTDNNRNLGTSSRRWSNAYIATTHGNLDGNANTSGKVIGSYTASGGKQPPNYFGRNYVGFLMMNTTVNGNSQYKDWIISDCYSGSDVGGGTAIGVNRQQLGAYIMGSDAARTSWTRSAELLGTHNVKDYVTEQGTSSGWTYRKWSSGRKECWRSSTVSALCNAVHGSVYRSTARVSIGTFPASFFSSAPVVQVTPMSASYDFWITGPISVSTSNAGTAFFYQSTPQNTTGNYTFHIYAIGS